MCTRMPGGLAAGAGGSGFTAVGGLSTAAGPAAAAGDTGTDTPEPSAAFASAARLCDGACTHARLRGSSQPASRLALSLRTTRTSRQGGLAVTRASHPRNAAQCRRSAL